MQSQPARRLNVQRSRTRTNGSKLVPSFASLRTTLKIAAKRGSPFRYRNHSNGSSNTPCFFKTFFSIPTHPHSNMRAPFRWLPRLRTSFAASKTRRFKKRNAIKLVTSLHELRAWTKSNNLPLPSRLAFWSRRGCWAPVSLATLRSPHHRRQLGRTRLSRARRHSSV